MQIKLKPFLKFDVFATPPCVRSELMYTPISADQVELMTALASEAGIEARNVTQDQFKVLEQFNNLGFITFFDHPMHPLVGLHDVELSRALELLSNVTVKIIDLTAEHREYFINELLDLGVTLVEDNPALTVVITDSYTKLSDASGPMLPVVLNRFRPSIGPLQTPWRENITLQTETNVAYMTEPNVKLPRAFNDLQRAWAVINIFHFIIRSDTSKVDNIVELNMLTMKQEWWPVQL